MGNILTTVYYSMTYDETMPILPQPLPNKPMTVQSTQSHIFYRTIPKDNDP